MTLYEMLKKRLNRQNECCSPTPAPLPKSEEDKIQNPLKLKVGSPVLVDELDHRQLSFKVLEIRQLLVNGEQYHKDDLIFIVDYIIGDIPSQVFRLIRLIPDSTHEIGFHTILTSQYHDQGYSEDFLNTLNDESGEFVEITAGVETARYWRIDEIEGPVHMHTKVLTDRNKDGRVDPNEVQDRSLSTWDFHRNTLIDGVEMEEFLFAEMDGENGWFTLWRGTEIHPERIHVL